MPNLLTKPLFVMNQQNLEKQENLIRVLLAYPTQASKVLNNNLKLIDHNFVKLVEQKSTKIMSYGNYQAANFLKDLNSQIKLHFLPEVMQVDKQTITTCESSVNWENELQKLNLRAQEISSRENRESDNESEAEETIKLYKWIPFFILTISLIFASGGLLWYRVSGYRLFGNNNTMLVEYWNLD